MTRGSFRGGGSVYGVSIQGGVVSVQGGGSLSRERGLCPGRGSLSREGVCPGRGGLSGEGLRFGGGAKPTQ